MQKEVLTSTAFEGVSLDTSWTPESGVPVNELPDTPGLYAEICWPRLGVRIGETGKSIRGKIRHDICWFKCMHEGTAPPAQLRRTLPIGMAAKELGPDAFEFYVVSSDPRLKDKVLRQNCERHMFRWLEQHDSFQSWNHQRSWR